MFNAHILQQSVFPQISRLLWCADVWQHGLRSPKSSAPGHFRYNCYREILAIYGWWPTRDSSVGRAGDCSMINLEIPRSAVRLRLAGTANGFKGLHVVGNGKNVYTSPKVTHIPLSQMWHGIIGCALRQIWASLQHVLFQNEAKVTVSSRA